MLINNIGLANKEIFEIMVEDFISDYNADHADGELVLIGYDVDQSGEPYANVRDSEGESVLYADGEYITFGF